MSLPIDTEYLAFIRTGAFASSLQYRAHENANSDVLPAIGISLSALYQAATCYRHCFNNGHILEGLAGRAHNQSYGAIQLAEIGLYDEALNLIRGVGEIANLIAALSSDQSRIRAWIECTDAERKRRFSPAKVREMLARPGASMPVLMDQDQYSSLCAYTHMAPTAQVGVHGKEDKSWIGPVFQEKGARTVLITLFNVVTPLAAMICAYFKFPDLLDALKNLSGFEQSDGAHSRSPEG